MEKKKIDLLREIRRAGFATGSRLFGCFDEKSDYDYVISRNKYKQILKELNIYDPVSEGLFTYDGNYANGDNEDGSFLSFHISYNSKNYNVIIPWEDKVTKSWEFATDNLKQFPKDLIMKKMERIKLFECLKDIYLERSQK